MAGQVIQGDEDQSISDINVVPLTDVMLVLLIVFLITTQVIKQAVPIKLPAVRYEPTTTKPDNVSLTVRNGPGGTCEVYWLLKRVSQKDLIDMAVTPLIDVMLVLLIMFIITIPVQTHAVKLDLPQNTNTPPPPIEPQKNIVVVTHTGEILWNGTAVSAQQLRQYLDVTQQMN